jgi:hypothetical protein
MRLDVLIFAILYPITCFPSVNLLRQHWIPAAPEEPSNGTFAFIVDHLDVAQLEPFTFTVMSPFIVAGLHVLVMLVATWSIKFKSFLYFQTASEQIATHVRFIPKPHRGSAEIVSFDRSTEPPTAIYQQKKREFKGGSFVSLTYPVDLPLSDYLDSRGLR